MRYLPTDYRKRESIMKTQSSRRVQGFGWLAFFACGALLAGLVLGQTSDPAAAPPRPAPVSAANKAAAAEQFQVAKNLYDAGKFTDANVENEKALRLDPANASALALKAVLASKVGASTSNSATTKSVAASRGALKNLTPQQISTVRLMEMSPADTAVRGKIDGKVVEEFWSEVLSKDPMVDSSKAAHDNFVRAGNFVTQAGRIRDSGVQKYIEQVSITTDPIVMTAYKNNVRAFVMQNCATADCHGGEKAGSFRLANGTGDAVDYTNFYVLSMYANTSGKMLDRDTPENSLLLQYALPKTAARSPHPVVEVRRFTGTNDARFRSIYEWIKALNLPRPKYGIEAAVTAPATRP
jgi:hypothetical protein